jgi:hypothetical protein
MSEFGKIVAEEVQEEMGALLPTSQGSNNGGMRKPFTKSGVEEVRSEAELRNTLEAKLKQRAEVVAQNKGSVSAALAEDTPVKPEDPNMRIVKSVSGNAVPVYEEENEKEDENNYNYVVFHMCNKENRPKAEKAGFRVLGFFPTKAAAYEQWGEWLRMNPRIGNDCAVHLLKAGKWFHIAETFAQQQDGEHCQKVIDEVLSNYYEVLEAHRLEFRANVEARKTGEASEKLKEKLREEQKEKRRKHQKPNQEQVRKIAVAALKDRQRKANTDVTKAMLSWPNDLLIRHQNVVVFSYILDPSTQNLIVRLNASFADDKEADAWKSLATQKIKHFHLDTVDMYEWKTPAGVDSSKVAEKFRNEALNDIMNQPKKEQEKLESFEEWCNDEDAPKPENTITSSGEIIRSEAAKKAAVDVRHEEGKFVIREDANGRDIVTRENEVLRIAKDMAAGNNEDVPLDPTVPQSGLSSGVPLSQALQKPEIDMSSRDKAAPLSIPGASTLGNPGRRERREARLQKS